VIEDRGGIYCLRSKLPNGRQVSRYSVSSANGAVNISWCVADDLHVRPLTYWPTEDTGH